MKTKHESPYLIVHRFAPELNKLVYKGRQFKASHCFTVREAKRSNQLLPVTKWVKEVQFSITYPEPFTCLNRIKGGITLDYITIQNVKKDILSYHYQQDRKLLSGDELPYPELKISIKSKFC